MIPVSSNEIGEGTYTEYPLYFSCIMYTGLLDTMGRLDHPIASSCYCVPWNSHHVSD